jgi:hypothetical protein
MRGAQLLLQLPPLLLQEVALSFQLLHSLLNLLHLLCHGRVEAAGRSVLLLQRLQAGLQLPCVRLATMPVWVGVICEVVSCYNCLKSPAGI